MEVFDGILLGFSVAFTAENLLFCLIGVLLGTLIGVLPGIGPVATIAMLLPLTYALTPVAALIMLAGIYYGAQYGGSTTAILVNLPGESSSVVTALDGYRLARQGKAGRALAVAAIGSFIGGTVGTAIVAGFAVPLAELAFKFGPAEYFALMVLGLVGAVVLAAGDPVKSFAMVLLGLLLGLIGMDQNSSLARFSFDIPELTDGIGFVVVAMAVFGIAEIVHNLERPEARGVSVAPVSDLRLGWREFREALPAILRGTGLGSILGVLPGGGALIASFAAYALEKKVARDPSRFGKGAIEGVAGPESANNAGAQTSFVPLLVLGLPSNAVMAMMVGAMTIHSIVPGPQVISTNPQLFWGLIASMWIGNAMLVVLNLPLVGLWVKLLQVPYRLLYPAILLFCAIGLFTLNNNSFDILLMAIFAAIGLALSRLGCELAPLLLGLILGPLMELNLRRALLISGGDWSVFATRPISAALLAGAAFLLLLIVLPAFRRTRHAAFADDSTAKG
jgi:putative tricarboxylic transport membrane protein